MTLRYSISKRQGLTTSQTTVPGIRLDARQRTHERTPRVQGSRRTQSDGRSEHELFGSYAENIANHLGPAVNRQPGYRRENSSELSQSRLHVKIPGACVDVPEYSGMSMGVSGEPGAV